MPLETNDTPSINTLHAPKTWQQLDAMHQQAMSDFFRERTAALSHPETGSVFAALDSTLARERCGYTGDTSIVLPAGLQKTANEYLQLMGVQQKSAAERALHAISERVGGISKGIRTFFERMLAQGAH